jgi:hypothetical protein
MERPHGRELQAVSGAPVKKLPASPRLGSPSVPVTDSSSEKVNKGQIDYWNDFYDHVMTLPVEPEDFVWHRDPVFCLACVTTVHIINNFARCSHDPVAFAQLKADAPTEWSFSSLEEDEGTDDADWWKTHC